MCRWRSCSGECPECIKKMVGKLDALEDALKKREADIAALKNAHDNAEARAPAVCAFAC